MTAHPHPKVRKEDVDQLNRAHAPWRIERITLHVGSPNRAAYETVATNRETGETIYRCEGWSQASRGQALNAILERETRDAHDRVISGQTTFVDEVRRILG